MNVGASTINNVYVAHGGDANFAGAFSVFFKYFYNNLL